MEPWELVARVSIRDLVARYNANGDSGRFDELLALFAADAVIEIGDDRYVGHDAIRAMLTEAAERFTGPPVRHFTASLQIDIESPTAATSRCYFQVLRSHGLDHWGGYLDEFAFTDGRWLFTHRRVRVDGTTPRA